MNRKLSIVAMLLFLVSAGTAHARIKIVEKSGVAYGSWTSSWGLRDDGPNEYPMGIATHKTKAAAVAAAKRHMAKTRGNGSYAVTHYLIEGVPGSKATQRVKRAKDALTRLREAKDAVDHAKKYKQGEASLIRVAQRKLGDVAREFAENVKRALGRIDETKKTLTGGVASQTDAQFRKVNGLIDRYNRDVRAYQGVMGSPPSFRHGGQFIVARPLKHVQPRPEKEKADSIAGTEWVYIDSGATYKFLSDGTYIHHLRADPRIGLSSALDLKGTWSQKGDTIIMSREKLFTVTVSGNEMTFKSRKLARAFVYRKQ